MAKQHDISSRAGRAKFASTLGKGGKDPAVRKLYEATYRIVCPHCRAKISAPPGDSVCAQCGRPVSLNLDIRI